MKVITVTNLPHLAQPLINSLERHGWDYHVCETEWKGFGTKLIETYRYLKANPEIDEFVFCDAHDVVCLGGEEEFREKLPNCDMFVSGEKGLWPPILHPFRSSLEPINCDSEFKFINSGCYYAKSKFFISLMEDFPPYHDTDDQYWLNSVSMLRYIKVDRMQTIFNSHSFIDEGEYTYDSGRVGINGNFPIFIHSNGKTVDPKLDEMLKNL